VQIPHANLWYSLGRFVERKLTPAVLSHLGSFVRQYHDGLRRRNVTDAQT